MHLRKRHALALLPVLACLGGVESVGAEPPIIVSKEAQARQVLAQVNDLNRSLGHSVEAYNRATWQLGQTKRSLKANTQRLAATRAELARVQRMLAARAVAIYESGDPNPTLELLLGARTLGELLDQYDAVRRIAAADVKIVLAVRHTRERVARERTALERAHVREARLVGEARAQRNTIQARLAERGRLLSSIRGELVRLKAEEAARQERLRREALARIAAERRAEALARRQAAARAEATRRDAETLALKRQADAEAAAKETAAVPTTTEAAPPPPAPPPAPAPASPPPAPAAAPPAPAPPASTDLGVAAETPEGASVAPPPSHSDVVDLALHYLGIPYQWGGASPSGFDCSGFTMYVYSQVGVSLPHYSGAQFGYGVAVSRDQLAPGDLVFFDSLDHVGIYIGGGQFVHSPHTGDVVKISSLSEDWYARKYDGARRI